MRMQQRQDSLELLISDLIYKLGKANQQIHTLTSRIANLELQQTNTHKYTIPSDENESVTM